MLGTSYSELDVDLKKMGERDASEIGAIAAAATMAAGLPVVDEIYKEVLENASEVQILGTQKQNYLNQLYKVYTKFKLTETIQLRQNDFVMPPQGSEDFDTMLAQDVSKLGSNVTTIAKIYKDLAESQYKNIKETIDAVKKRDVTDQFRVDGGVRFYGLAKIKIDGKEQTLAEYIVEKKLGQGHLDNLKSMNPDNHEEYLKAVADNVPDLGDAGYVEFLRENLGLGDDALRALAVAPLQNYYEAMVSEIPYSVKVSARSDDLMIRSGNNREMVLEVDTSKRTLNILSKARYELVDMEAENGHHIGESVVQVSTSFGEPRTERVGSISELFEDRSGFAISAESVSLHYHADNPLMSVSLGEAVEVGEDSVESSNLGSYSDIVDIVHRVTGVEKGAKGSRIYGVAGRLKSLMRKERDEPRLAVEGLQVTRGELKKLAISIVEEQKGVESNVKKQQVKAIEKAVYESLIGRQVMGRGDDFIQDSPEAKVAAPSRMAEIFKKILKKSGRATGNLAYLKEGVVEFHGIRPRVSATRESRGR